MAKTDGQVLTEIVNEGKSLDSLKEEE